MVVFALSGEKVVIALMRLLTYGLFCIARLILLYHIPYALFSLKQEEEGNRVILLTLFAASGRWGW